MAVLKWCAVILLALVGGYFGHKWTGTWIGAAVAAFAVAMVCNSLINGQWLIAGAAFCLGGYVVFSMMGEGDYRGAAQAPRLKEAAVRDGGEAQRDASTLPSAAQPVAPVTASPGAAAGSNQVVKDCPQCPDLVVVPAGQFLMGSPKVQSQGAAASAMDEPTDPRETPQHRVAVRSFAAGRFAVTKAEFAAFVQTTQYQTEAEREGGCFAWTAGNWENNPSLSWRQAGFSQMDDHPVVCVSWNDAQAYVRWLSAISHKNYRLLSESEREYAARAGSTFAFWWGEHLSADRANYDTTAPGYHGSRKGDWRRATVSVDQLGANPFGLYNMHGNVWEWVQDCQHDTYAGAPTDGSAWVSRCTGSSRILRGGAWVGDPAGLRSTSRGWFSPGFRFHGGGFRVARSISPKN